MPNIKVRIDVKNIALGWTCSSNGVNLKCVYDFDVETSWNMLIPKAEKKVEE
jgi:hypothetical protein